MILKFKIGYIYPKTLFYKSTKEVKSKSVYSSNPRANPSTVGVMKKVKKKTNDEQSFSLFTLKGNASHNGGVPLPLKSQRYKKHAKKNANRFKKRIF